MSRPFFLVLAAAAAAAATPASAMTVAEFLGKANALKAMGMRALFHPDYKALQAEGRQAGEAIRREQIAAQAVGRKPATCVPKGQKLGSNEVLGYFESLSPAQRSQSVKTAMTGLVRRKWPCPA